MYNAKYIWPGIVLFVVLFTAPFWVNIGTPEYKRPAVALPTTEKECVEPREYMASEHMQLLDTWRDMALREDKREYVSTSGKKWEISLQNTCMSCHTNKVEFCDKCHDTNGVDPYCWDCHVEPRGNN
ncbi:sulfate reduction electron transfer complex DsrMKJOP subunit DsrJ [Desulfovibrio sp. OttesenSCG-928-G15]|nr:sulfate reduction electron transfer complex DsrMKJOP subunit DsrJ [Desulfovibrio sp. OttesenSCG-928-G15]